MSAIMILQERYEEAVEELKAVINSNPEDDITLENAYFNLGICYLRMDKHKEALAAFEAALEIEPWDMAAYVNAAIIAEHLGMNEKAIKYWTRYDRLLPVNKRKKEIKAKLKELTAKAGTKGAPEKTARWRPLTAAPAK
jgi:tetratricopeptide (TPR) repeat protein